MIFGMLIIMGGPAALALSIVDWKFLWSDIKNIFRKRL
jgi:hypothetical protein